MGSHHTDSTIWDLDVDMDDDLHVKRKLFNPELSSPDELEEPQLSPNEAKLLDDDPDTDPQLSPVSQLSDSDAAMFEATSCQPAAVDNYPISLEDEFQPSLRLSGAFSEYK